MGSIFKVFIELVTILLVLCFVFLFWLEACGILAHLQHVGSYLPRIELTPSALKSEVLTIGPPGKFPNSVFKSK